MSESMFFLKRPLKKMSYDLVKYLTKYTIVASYSRKKDSDHVTDQNAHILLKV
jgi:hypothetical protein